MFLYLSLFLITNLVICFIFCRRKTLGFNQKLYVKIGILLFGLIVLCFLALFILMIYNDHHYSNIYCNYYAVTSLIDEGSTNNL